MKKLLPVVLFFISFYAVGQDAATLHETARGFLRQGDYENSILVLNKALQIKPNDLQLHKDLLFSYYLKRDFAKAMEVGKPLIEREDADVQTYQMMGMVYKAIAEEKEAEKLYKKGLKKFPNEGVLYAEFGEMLAPKNEGDAVKLWESGVAADQNHSSNYYFLARHYAQKNEYIWSLLYGEMFLNMESFTARSTEMKNLLLEQYKKFFISGYQKPAADPKKPVAFTTAVADVLQKQQSQVSFGVTPETLTIIRTRFVLDWYNQYGDKFPFRLFEHQRQLLQEGLFEAYNHWLFGPAANLRAYQTWQQYHQDDLNEFLGFIRSKVFKIPEGQQYRMM